MGTQIQPAVAEFLAGKAAAIHGLVKNVKGDIIEIGRHLTEASQSDLTRACEHAAKNAILQHHTRIDTTELVEALIERRGAHQ
jgi:hypothetical protein